MLECYWSPSDWEQRASNNFITSEWSSLEAVPISTPRRHLIQQVYRQISESSQKSCLIASLAKSVPKKDLPGKSTNWSVLRIASPQHSASLVFQTFQPSNKPWPYWWPGTSTTETTMSSRGAVWDQSGQWVRAQVELLGQIDHRVTTGPLDHWLGK